MDLGIQSMRHLVTKKFSEVGFSLLVLEKGGNGASAACSPLADANIILMSKTASEEDLSSQ